jgi:hypothetical protein
MLSLLRHGQTDWTSRPTRRRAWVAVPLNDSGREQTLAEAERPATLGIADLHKLKAPCRRLLGVPCAGRVERIDAFPGETAGDVDVTCQGGGGGEMAGGRRVAEEPTAEEDA